MKPTIGRIVHFYDHSRPGAMAGNVGPHAAIVTSVAPSGERVCLTVFPSSDRLAMPPVGAAAVDTKALDEVRYWEWPPIGRETA